MTTPSRCRIRSASLLGTILLALPALAAEPAPAGDAAATAPPGAAATAGGHGRELNGHVFMPADDVRGALVTTSFTSGLLVGLGSAHADFQVGDRTLSGDFEYAGVGAVLGYEYAPLDYLSVRLAVSELIYSGTTGRSAIVVGTSLQGGAGAGVTLSLPIGDSLRVGALFDATYGPNFALTVGQALKTVIDSCSEPSGCDVDSGSAFTAKNVFELKPGVAANWAPLPSLGFTANATYVRADQTINGHEFNGNAMELGAAADFDFAAISPVPIGLQVQFSWLAPNGSALQHVTDLGGGIFYTGRKELALGIQIIARRFAVTPDVDVSWSTFVSNIGMRYYW